MWVNDRLRKAFDEIHAEEELKQKATYITDSIDCDGIMKALIHEGIA